MLGDNWFQRCTCQNNGLGFVMSLHSFFIAMSLLSVHTYQQPRLLKECASVGLLNFVQPAHLQWCPVIKIPKSLSNPTFSPHNLTPSQNVKASLHQGNSVLSTCLHVLRTQVCLLRWYGFMTVITRDMYICTLVPPCLISMDLGWSFKLLTPSGACPALGNLGPNYLNSLHNCFFFF